MGDLLKGMNCVVTGASRGIGRDIALSYAKEGANIIITYLSREEKAIETVNEIKGFGVKAHCFKCNASDEDEVIKLKSFILEKFGTINVLVNNAGLVGNEKPVTEITGDEWDEIMNVDVKGVFLSVKHLVSLFNQKEVCKIINISSELSIKGRANFVPYTAAKGAVNSMTRSLALELAPKILVNTIAPGPIETDMITMDMSDEWIEKEKDIPLKRLGTVSEISGTAILLASEYGNFYCGQFLSPNGGAVFI